MKPTQRCKPIKQKRIHIWRKIFFEMMVAWISGFGFCVTLPPWMQHNTRMKANITI